MTSASMPILLQGKKVNLDDIGSVAQDKSAISSGFVKITWDQIFWNLQIFLDKYPTYIYEG